MSADTATVEIVFPRHVVVVDSDRVTIVLERGHLPRLRAYLYALEAGLIAVDGVTGVGHG